MSGCHPDATTKKIAGERETRGQKEENPRNTAGNRTKEKDGIQCRGKEERKPAEYRGEQNKGKPAFNAGEKKKENRGIPRGTGHTKKTGRRCP